MIVMFITSNTSSQRQDVKPLLKKYVTLTPNTLPDIQFLYDSNLVTTQQPYDFLEFFIRKSGHVLEYMILTFVLLMMLPYTKIKLWLRILIAFIGSFLFASTDEYHQTYVDGRTGHFIDVYTFDTAGIIFGIIIYLLIQSVKRTHR